MVSGKLRISILNIPEELNPLKLRGYLRHEAQDIQAGCSENDLVLIRVFMAKSFKSRVPQHELDKIFRAIVDKMPNIQRIEYIETDKQQSFEEMAAHYQNAKDDLEQILEQINKNESDDKPPTFH